LQALFVRSPTFRFLCTKQAIHTEYTKRFAGFSMRYGERHVAEKALAALPVPAQARPLLVAGEPKVRCVVDDDGFAARYDAAH
jgi:hypothetical protein